MKKLLTVTLFSGLLTLLRMASGFVIAKVVAVYTGPSGITMLGQIQSLFSALNGIAAAPAGSGVVRYTAEFQAVGFDDCAPWWRAAIKWVLMLLAGIIPLACIFSKLLAYWVFGDVNYFWVILVVSLLLPFSVANTMVASVINGQHQYRRFIWLSMVAIIVATAVMVLLVIFGSLDGAMIAAAIFTGINGMVMLIGSMRQPWFRLKYWWGTTDKSKMKDIGGYVAMAVTSAVTMPLALIIVRKILIDQTGWESAGHWQAVWKVSEVYLGVIGVALSTYFLPKLASLKGLEVIKKEIQDTAKIVMPIVILFAIAVYLLRDVAIGLLFTEAFRPARNLFAIQLIGDVVKVYALLYAYSMVSCGSSKWYISTEIAFSVSFTGLAYILVPRFGINGGNIAYALNYIAYLIFLRSSLSRFVR